MKLMGARHKNLRTYPENLCKIFKILQALTSIIFTIYIVGHATMQIVLLCAIKAESFPQQCGLNCKNVSYAKHRRLRVCFYMLQSRKGHSVTSYIRSLALLTCSTSLRLPHLHAPFTGSLTHFTHSLVGQLKFLNMCSR